MMNSLKNKSKEIYVLTAKQKATVREGLKDVEEGRTVSHKKLRRKLPNGFQNNLDRESQLYMSTTRETSKITRQIRWYEKNGEKLVGEIDIPDFPNSELFQLIIPPQNDPLLYNCYQLDKVLLDRLNSILVFPLDYDLEKNEYFLEATDKAN